MNFLQFPTDIILNISNYLDKKDFLNLISTNKLIYNNESLYYYYIINKFIEYSKYDILNELTKFKNNTYPIEIIIKYNNELQQYYKNIVENICYFSDKSSFNILEKYNIVNNINIFYNNHNYLLLSCSNIELFIHLYNKYYKNHKIKTKYKLYSKILRFFINNKNLYLLSYIIENEDIKDEFYVKTIIKNKFITSNNIFKYTIDKYYEKYKEYFNIKNILIKIVKNNNLELFRYIYEKNIIDINYIKSNNFIEIWVNILKKYEIFKYIINLDIQSSIFLEYNYSLKINKEIIDRDEEIYEYEFNDIKYDYINVNINMIIYLMVNKNIKDRGKILIDIFDKYKELLLGEIVYQHTEKCENTDFILYNDDIFIYSKFNFINYLYKNNRITIDDISTYFIERKLYLKNWFNLFIKLGFNVDDINNNINDYRYYLIRKTLYPPMYKVNLPYTNINVKFKQPKYKNLLYYIDKYNIIVYNEEWKDCLINLIQLNNDDKYYYIIRELIDKNIFTKDIINENDIIFYFNEETDYIDINNYRSEELLTKYIDYKNINSWFFIYKIFSGEHLYWKEILLNFKNNGLDKEYFKGIIFNIFVEGVIKEVLLYLSEENIFTKNNFIEYFNIIEIDNIKENRYNKILNMYN